MPRETRFSVLIPSWNNLHFLRACVQRIRQHSCVEHEILVFVNEGSDGSADWLTVEGIRHISSPENQGVCKALNRLAEAATHDWLLYLNDDMIVLPGWDSALSAAIDAVGHNRCYLSATMIEPEASGNDCVMVRDFGRDPDSFDETALLDVLESLKRPHWNGATWPPSLLHRELWNEVGGYSEEFSPGLYSDPDLSMKLWQTGVRHFQGVGDSLVYHFMKRSTGRVRMNDGRRQFLDKWGITASYFKRQYLRLGSEFSGPLPEADFHPSRLLMPIKRLTGL